MLSHSQPSPHLQVKAFNRRELGSSETSDASLRNADPERTAEPPQKSLLMRQKQRQPKSRVPPLIVAPLRPPVREKGFQLTDAAS